jgi:hypothetical protein
MAERPAGSGGVRNIRAMFEAKNEQTSPPSRGRSPVEGSDNVRSSSSRPLSKVRASFVAVEKSGQMGPILGLRRVSDVIDGSSSGLKHESSAIDGPPGDSKISMVRSISNTGSHSQTIEEENIEPETLNQNTSKSKPTEEKADKSGPANEKVKTNDQKKVEEEPKTPKASSFSRDKISDVNKAKSREETVKDPVKKNSDKPSVSKVQPVSKPVPVQPVKKQPTTPKALPDRTKPESATKTLASTSQAKLKPKLSTASLRSTTSTTTKPKATTIPKTPNLTQPKVPRAENPKVSSKMSSPRTSLPAGAGKENNKPVKSRPKSPTKPQRLPSSLTASTASSAAKTVPDRPVSRSSSKPRPSTDNDFLTRMMRPTASSASKTHDKPVPKTPPRKTEAAKPRRKSESHEKVTESKVHSAIENAEDPHTNTSVTTPIKKKASAVNTPISTPRNEAANLKDSNLPITPTKQVKETNLAELTETQKDEIEPDIQEEQRVETEPSNVEVLHPEPDAKTEEPATDTIREDITELSEETLVTAPQEPETENSEENFTELTEIKADEPVIEAKENEDLGTEGTVIEAEVTEPKEEEINGIIREKDLKINNPEHDSNELGEKPLETEEKTINIGETY